MEKFQQVWGVGLGATSRVVGEGSGPGSGLGNMPIPLNRQTNRMTDTSENITSPQTACVGGNDTFSSSIFY